MSNEQFLMAQRMADLAADLDDSKSGFELRLRFSAINCAREMHKMAGELAGERIGEIYDLTEVATS